LHLSTRTFEAAVRTLGEYHPDTLLHGLQVAFDLIDTGDPDTGRSLQRRQLARLRNSLGDDHPDVIANHRPTFSVEFAPL
jgi:hypothetical protein